MRTVVARAMLLREPNSEQYRNEALLVSVAARVGTREEPLPVSAALYKERSEGICEWLPVRRHHLL